MTYRYALKRVALYGLVASCLSQPLAAQTLDIGAIGSLSGGGTQWGIAMRRAVEIAVEEANEAGGIEIDGAKRQLKLTMYDDQYTGQGGTTAATRLVNLDNIKFILGPIGSPPALGALGVTSPAKVLMMSNGFSPRILTPNSLWNFRVIMSSLEFAPALVSWVRTNNPGAKRMALVTTNDATGQAAIDILNSTYKAQGFEVVGTERYERGVNDFSPLLTRIIATRADVLELSSNPPSDTGLIVRQARQLGFKGLIVQTGGPGMEEVINIAGKDAEGFISYSSYDPTDSRIRPFQDKYRKRHGEFIDPNASLFYNGAKIMFEGLRRAKTADVEKVTAELEKMGDFESPLGMVRWSGKKAYGINHQLLVDIMIAKVSGGKVEYVGKVTPPSDN